MILNLVFNLIGGLGIFIFGMKAMSEALQVLAGDRMRRIINAATNNRFVGVGTGLLVTMIVQSSSVTTVMVVSFVNAGLMTLFQAASVILGANVGTTITGWILVLQLHKSALPILGLGAFVHLLAKRESLKFFGQFAMGFGMVFFGLTLMQSGFAPLKEDPELAHFVTQFGAEGIANLLLTVLIGAVLTILLQSSSAALGITIAMATVGLVDFKGAAALILGGNIGTTITAQLAAIKATADARRAAMFHTTVNVLGVLTMVLLFPMWIGAVNALTPGNPDVFDAAGQRPYITAHIAVAHTSFNLMVVALALPFLRTIVRLVQTMVGEAGAPRTSLKFLHPRMIGSPALAIEHGRHEVFHMADITTDVLHLTRDLYRDFSINGDSLRERVLKKERITDTVQHEITVFMSRVMAGVLTMAQVEEIRSLIRAADEIESVSDYCERLANYRRRLVRDHVVFSADALRDIQDYLDRTIAFYEEIVDRAKRSETGWLAAVQMKGRYLLDGADALREGNLQRLSSQKSEPEAGIFFSDMLVAMRRIRNHSYNMAEAFLGRK